MTATATKDFRDYEAPGATEDFDVCLEHIAAHDGVLIPTRVYGAGNSHTPIVLSHGLQSHSGWFVQSGAFLSRRGFPVYALDRRGSGLSEAPRGDCQSFQTMLDDIRAVAEHAMSTHHTKQVHIFGHCFGAMPATAFACAHPEFVKSLVLATPGIFTKDDLKLSQKLQVVTSQITKRESLIPAPLAPEVFSDLDQYTQFIRDDELMLREMTASLFWQVLQMRGFIRNEKDKLTMPVFMLTAGRDTICDNDRNRAFFATLPTTRKRLVEYSQTRHVLEFGPQREEAFRDIAHWLQGLEESNC